MSRGNPAVPKIVRRKQTHERACHAVSAREVHAQGSIIQYKKPSDVELGSRPVKASLAQQTPALQANGLTKLVRCLCFEIVSVAVGLLWLVVCCWLQVAADSCRCCLLAAFGWQPTLPHIFSRANSVVPPLPCPPDGPFDRTRVVMKDSS